jgi:hypothetical protein
VSNREPADDEARGLRVLVEEVRRSRPPPLDWERVERQLLAKIDIEQFSRRRQRSPHAAWGSVAAFAAVAAALVMIIAGQGEGNRSLERPDPARAVDLSRLPTHRESADELPTYMVAAMRPRSVVESQGLPLRFSLPGVATWWLEPHSRVVVETVSVPHVIELEQGTVHAEVVPREESNELVESFAVQAASTRVAVHGTVFSVSRDHDRVTVEVTRGSVTVGPARHRGITTGHLLTSPAIAAFGLDGLPIADPAASVRPAGPDPATARAPEPSTPSRSASLAGAAPSGSAKSEPEVEPSLLTADLARGLVMGCLRERWRATTSDDTRVALASRVTVTRGTDGHVGAVRFEPPLTRDLQSACAGALFGQRMPDAGSITFSIQLSR